MSTMFCHNCGLKVEVGSGLHFCTVCGEPLIDGAYGRFEIRRVIGNGPAGVVVLAHDPTLERDVALRLIAAAVTDDQIGFARLVESARTMASQQHANWVQVYELADIDGTAAVVMEFVDGTSLGGLVANGGLVPRDCAAAFAGAIDGIEHLHNVGLTHGDLTPNNVLLDRLGTSKIADVASPLDLTPGALSLGFAAPEQLTGAEPSVAADVYALGTLVYAAATGRAPFPTSSLEEALAARDVALDLTGVSSVLAPLIEECVHVDPTKRPATAAIIGHKLAADADAEFGVGWRMLGTSGLAAGVAGVVGASVMAGGASAGGSAAAGAAAGGAAASSSAASTQAASGGLMATIAAKPVVAGAIAVGAVAVVGVCGFTAYKAFGSSEQAPVVAEASPSPEVTAAAWVPVPEALNGAAPPGLPEVCYKVGAKTPPTITLTDGVGEIPGTKGYGKYTVIGTPVKGRFVEGGADYTVYAFQCIGDGNYQMSGLTVVDAAGNGVTTTPATTLEAVTPYASQYAPGGSISGSSQMSFGVAGTTPTLSGTWSARGGGGSASFVLKVGLNQAAPGAPITQDVTPVTPIPVAPGIAKGLSFYTPAFEDPSVGSVTIERKGNSVTMELSQPAAGVAKCFKGKVTNEAFVGETKEYSADGFSSGTLVSTSKKPIPFTTNGQMLTINGIDYSLEEPEGITTSSLCS